MTRFFFLFLLFAGSSLCSAGQSYKDDIRNQFLKYTGHLMNKEFRESMEYMNPALFEMVSRDQLIAAMEATFNNPMMDVKVSEARVLSVGDKKNIDGMDYVKMEYGNYLHIRFGEQGADLNPDQIKTGLQQQYGKEAVTYDAQTGFYKIYIVKKVVANSKDGKKWTFTVIEEKQRKVLEAFIPAELL